MTKNKIISMLESGVVLPGLLGAMTLCGCQNNVKTAEAVSSAVSTIDTLQHTEVDTIYSFFGHKLSLKDSVFQQIKEIASKDDFLSVEEKWLKTGKVKWDINITHEGIILFSSVDPDDKRMTEVVSYLNVIYGKPYEYETCFNIKWSSSKDSTDIFAGNCTLVYLHGTHTDKSGTFLTF